MGTGKPCLIFGIKNETLTNNPHNNHNMDRSSNTMGVAITKDLDWALKFCEHLSKLKPRRNISITYKDNWYFITVTRRRYGRLGRKTKRISKKKTK